MQAECLAPINATAARPNATRTGRSRSTQGDENLAALFAGQMQFSVDLFKALFDASQSEGKSAGDNMFVSPMSIYSALLLAYFGAHNRTEEQLGRVLGFKDADSKVYRLADFLTITSFIDFNATLSSAFIVKLE